MRLSNRLCGARCTRALALYARNDNDICSRCGPFHKEKVNASVKRRTVLGLFEFQAIVIITIFLFETGLHCRLSHLLESRSHCLFNRVKQLIRIGLAWGLWC